MEYVKTINGKAVKDEEAREKIQTLEEHKMYLHEIRKVNDYLGDIKFYAKHKEAFTLETLKNYVRKILDSGCKSIPAFGYIMVGDDFLAVATLSMVLVGESKELNVSYFGKSGSLLNITASSLGKTVVTEL